jgi:phosphatidylserine/phosphatidylglycerophosphate/cardiolipin synthase-like enzyme
MRHGTNKAAVLIVVLMLIGGLFSCAQEKEQKIDTSQVRVYFSPHGGCTEAIVAEIGKAKTEIKIQAYSFTSKPIAQAIAEAASRNVKVEIILDKSNRSDRYSAADFTAHKGIPTYIDDRHNIAHNKIMIIDQETVITGSFNFSRAAEESNAENLLIVKNRELASKYLDNWQKHRQHSDLYQVGQGRG